MITVKKASTLPRKLVKINCKKHGEQSSYSIMIMGKWTTPECGECVRSQATTTERKEAQDLNIKAKLKNALIPKRFENSSFENYNVKTEAQKSKKDFCIKYVKDFKRLREMGTSLIFCGNKGTGKTHLAAAICSEITKQHGRSALFLSVLKAVREVKETYSRNSQISEQQALDRFLRPELLVLDEVGVQFGSDAEKMILFEIINERYQNLLPTILISNLEPAELTDFVGERCIDRVRENEGAILKFDWDSYRLNK